MDAIAHYPGLRIVDSRYAGWLRKQATTQMDSVLREVGAIDCVFAHNDEMAQGASDALARAHRNEGVMVVGIDGLPSKGGGLEAVREKRISASCIYPTRGDLLLELAHNILEKKAFERENRLPAAARYARKRDTVATMQGIELRRQYQRLETLSKSVEEKVHSTQPEDSARAFDRDFLAGGEWRCHHVEIFSPKAPPGGGGDERKTALLHQCESRVPNAADLDCRPH